jgi:hypothetical protein
VAVVYGILTVMGLIPALDTTFGLIPLYGHDVWLHARCSRSSRPTSAGRRRTRSAAPPRRRRPPQPAAELIVRWPGSGRRRCNTPQQDRLFWVMVQGRAEILESGPEHNQAQTTCAPATPSSPPCASTTSRGRHPHRPRRKLGLEVD